MTSVLFVCTANLYRSPLAAAFLKKHVALEKEPSQALIIDSAGTWTKNGTLIHQQTIEDARHYDLDLHEHRSKQVSEELLTRQDLILVMEAGQKEALKIEFPKNSSRVYLLSEVVDNRIYDIPDPFSLEGFHDREIADELFRIIKRGHQTIIDLANKHARMSG